MAGDRSVQQQSMLVTASIFFASGFAALIYQITWQRALFSIFGINVEAVTVVVTGFLLGLGFGSLIGGRLSRMMPGNLLALFGAVELAIGLFGAVSLHVFQWVGERTLTLPATMTIAVTLTLVIAPTLLMGATLPMLTQHLVRHLKNVGRSVGLLYCVNTLGSAFACAGAGLWLMRDLGMQGVVLLAAAINLMVAAVAFWLAWKSRRRSTWWIVDRVRSRPLPEPLRHGLGFWFLFAVAVLTGYLSLSYEVLWFRAFVTATNQARTFALVLGVYLAGLAVGAHLARSRCVPSANGAGPVGPLCAVILASSVVGFLVLPLAAQAAGAGAASFVAAMLFLVFAQTAIAGAAFPLICYLGVAPDGRTGIGVSRIYVGNILGSAAGALTTGFVLMDLMSTSGISLLLAELGAGTAGAIALAGRASMSGPRRAAVAALIAGIAILGPIAVGALFDRFDERIVYKAELAQGPKFVELVENKSGVVAVNADAFVYGGGIYDGIVSVDLIEDKNLLVRPLSLALLHPHPRDVLVVGLATGAWAQILAANPDIERDQPGLPAGHPEIRRRQVIAAQSQG
jgi:spermidine synthase